MLRIVVLILILVLAIGAAGGAFAFARGDAMTGWTIVLLGTADFMAIGRILYRDFEEVVV